MRPSSCDQTNKFKTKNSGRLWTHFAKTCLRAAPCGVIDKGHYQQTVSSEAPRSWEKVMISTRRCWNSCSAPCQVSIRMVLTSSVYFSVSSYSSVSVFSVPLLSYFSHQPSSSSFLTCFLFLSSAALSAFRPFRFLLSWCFFLWESLSWRVQQTTHQSITATDQKRLCSTTFQILDQ